MAEHPPRKRQREHNRRKRLGRYYPPRPDRSTDIYLPEALGLVPPGEHSSRWWAARKRSAFARLPAALQDMVRAGRWLDSIEPWQLERFELGWRRVWDAYLEATRMGAAPDRKVELKRLAARRHALRGKLPPRFQPGQPQEHDYKAMRAEGHGRIADELETLYRRANELHRAHEYPLPDPSTARAQDLNTMRHRRIRYWRRYKQEGGEFTPEAKARWQPILDELESIIREREAEEYDAREREYQTAKREAERDGVICLAWPPHRPRWMLDEDHAEQLRRREESLLARQERDGAALAVRLARVESHQMVIDPRNAAYKERVAVRRAERQAKEKERLADHYEAMQWRVLDWAWGAGRVAPGSTAALVPVGSETWIAYPDGAIAWQTQRARAIAAVGVPFDGGWAFPPIGAAGRLIGQGAVPSEET